MTDNQKFSDIKKQLLVDNENKFKTEVKDKWGNKTWEESQTKFGNLTKTDWDKASKLDIDFKTTIKLAFESGDPKGDLAKKAVELHKQWLTIFWPTYSREAQLGLAQMYVADSRFHHYFDNNLELAKFFVKVVANI